MKPEILNGLLKSYIIERSSYDDVDSSQDGNLAGEYDNPFTSQYEDIPPQLQSQIPGEFLPDVPLPPKQAAEVAAAGKKLVELTLEFSSSHPEKSIIKFKDPCLFVSPEEETVSIPVIRSQCSIGKDLKAYWKTLDRTAVSGTHYLGSEGEIMFDKDTIEKEIKIKLIPFTYDNIDIRFQIELFVENSIFQPKKMNVNIKNINKLYDDERQVLHNMLQSSLTSVADISYLLNDCLNNRTFHAALSCVCSKADSLPLEIGLALELSRLCLPRLRLETVQNVLNDFFRFDDYQL